LPNTIRLLIHARSWQKNSFGLFDFEARETFDDRLTQVGSGQVVRDETLSQTDKRRVQRLNLRTVQGFKPVDEIQTDRAVTKIIAKVMQEGGK
jgi:hypothetical protein